MVYLHNIFCRFPPGEVTVFTWVSPDSNAQEETTGMRFIRRRYINFNEDGRKSKIRKLLMMLCWSIELTWLCWREKPDCLYVGEMFPVGVLGLWIRWLFGIPYIVFVYGEDLTKIIASGSWERISKTICRKADRVVTISRFTADLLVDCGVNAQRIVLVHPGVDSKRYNPAVDGAQLRSKLNLNGCKVVLTVGRLTKRKGHAQVISALPKVLKLVPEVRYLIVGKDVGVGEELRALVHKLGLEKHVIFEGYVNPDDFPQYYGACDLFVLANYELQEIKDTEGFGIVLLEASACGKPVIGGRAGGVVDAVADGETGLLVDATDVAAVTQALIQLLTDDEYASELGTKGRTRVVEQFSWEVAALSVREAGLAAVASRKDLARVRKMVADN